MGKKPSDPLLARGALRLEWVIGNRELGLDKDSGILSVYVHSAMSIDFRY